MKFAKGAGSAPCFPVLLLFVFSLLAAPLQARSLSNVVVFSQPGFPAADCATVSQSELQNLFAGAQFAAADKLGAQLSEPNTALLVLPYGSAFPEAAWPQIRQYLERGGNLLVLGGRPFTRAAYHDGSGWHLREYSVRFTRPLMIDQYQTTPGSEGLQVQDNPDIPLQLPHFSWLHGFSPIIRLSAVSLYPRGGAAGSIDARLDALAWGERDNHKMAAPAIEIDHLQNGFDGGRWVFVNAELSSDFFTGPNAAAIIHGLADRALQGSEQFTARPVLPLYLPGEPIQIELRWYAAKKPSGQLTARISVYPEGQPAQGTPVIAGIPAVKPVELPAPNGKGLYFINAELLDGNQVKAIYHSGFWIRDEAYLRSGPRLTVNNNYFEMDGKPIAVIGTTYMSSETQRLYFEHPNVYVWNQDLAQIHDAGLNMIRTGWWTGWDKFCDENGVPYERTLRTLEAYLMTARKYNLPVQFNFFAFLPDVLGGQNPYLDPDAVHRQETLVSSVVARFHDVPWLAWDLINEPSISQHLWTMLPNGDPIEFAAWNQWLSQRYHDPAALAAAWNIPEAQVHEGSIPLPDDLAFTPRGMYVGHNSLKVYDFYLFAQHVFDDWVQQIGNAIRSTGSQQLITVGQDEGGIQDRLSPAYWGKEVSFTTNHSWWQNDYILWDSIMAKQPGETMLIQETGLQRELNMDEVARRTPQNEAMLLERKIAMSFVHGAGAIEWLWNTNSYMTESNETPIGAVLPDGTEKPEAFVLSAYAQFARALGQHLVDPKQAPIAIVTSQAAQFSVIGNMQLTAQQNAVRALAYYDHLEPYGIAENRIARLGSPKLVILPSAQALREDTWKALLKYAHDGGNLLITGPVNRNEHWQVENRAADLNLAARSVPLTYHNAAISWNGRTIELAYNQDAQTWLDSLDFQDGSTFKVIPYGTGQIFWAAYPVELAEGLQPAAQLYSYIAARVGIQPMFDLEAPVSPGVMICPLELQDSVLYIMTSDTDVNTRIDLRDKITGAHLTLELPGQKAALALISKKNREILAKYGY
jgi:hypothetical protein